ncbi:MAG: hypothetical protein ACRYFR_04780 [Janthinobacterium lividum]
MKKHPFFLPHPAGAEAARKAERAVGVLFLFLFALLLAAKRLTFGF